MSPDDRSEKVGWGLETADCEALLATIQSIHECRSLAEFPLVVTTALSRILPCTLAAYNEVNVKLGRMKSLTVPVEPRLRELISIWERHMAEHPILQYYQETQDGQALTISDFLSEEAFHGLALYRDFFSKVEAEDQLAMGFFLGDSVVVGLAFNRGERSFTERDRRVLNLLRPHVVQAYAAAREFDELRSERLLLQEALGSIGHGVLRIDEEYRISHATPEALSVLGVLSAEELEAKPWLKQAVASFVDLGSKRLSMDVPNLPHVAILWQRVGGRIMGIVSERPLGRLSIRFGLSHRESEVLERMADGKSNAEIGAILGIAAGTVKIHVQKVLAKLGVPNRAAAVAMIRRPE